MALRVSEREAIARGWIVPEAMPVPATTIPATPAIVTTPPQPSALMSPGWTTLASNSGPNVRTRTKASQNESNLITWTLVIGITWLIGFAMGLRFGQ